jgi:hypothetical protein
MKAKRVAHCCLVVAFTLGLSACASGGAGGSGETEEAPAAPGDQVSVQVNNDIMPGANITVWIVPQAGSRRRLGTIMPSGQQTFRFSPFMPNQNFRLSADIEGGRGRTSNPFNLMGVREVRWAVSDVNVRVIR